MTSADAGQSVSLALKRVRKAQVRKGESAFQSRGDSIYEADVVCPIGMVIVHKTETPPRGM